MDNQPNNNPVDQNPVPSNTAGGAIPPNYQTPQTLPASVPIDPVPNSAINTVPVSPVATAPVLTPPVAPAPEPIPQTTLNINPPVQPATLMAQPQQSTYSSAVPSQPMQPIQQVVAPQYAAAAQTPTSTDSNLVSGSELAKVRARKKKILTVVLSLLVLMLLIAGGVFCLFRFYIDKDHSIYAKLAPEGYNNGQGINFGFNYPSVMKQAQGLEELTGNVGVSFATGTGDNAVVIGVADQDLSSTLAQYKLTPQQYIAEYHDSSGVIGGFLKAIRSQNNYSDPVTAKYKNCDNYVTTNSGQTDVLCYGSVNSITYAQLLGATTKEEYALLLTMPTNVWNAHQKVWQSVETSFHFK